MKWARSLGCFLFVGLVFAAGRAPAADPVRVLVWDEQQPVQKKVYPNFPGNWVADYLKKNDKLKVTSGNLNQPGTGLTKEVLDGTDVLVFWGHVRHDAVSVETSTDIVERIKAGKLQMITLHSAHWSVPFMIAMEEKAKADALARLPKEERSKATVVFTGPRERKVPQPEKRLFLKTEQVRKDDGSTEIRLERPNCVFPRCCTPSQPSKVRIINPKHPINKGIDKQFIIPETEMYDEPYHVPAPDEVILDESWAGGEYFRSGCLWNIGEGAVFYFRPGDQQYAVYKEEPVLKIIENACLWLGTK